jgi:septal ring factor EnvC (AmiA/AmiB activator)
MTLPRVMTFIILTLFFASRLTFAAPASTTASDQDPKLLQAVQAMQRAERERTAAEARLKNMESRISSCEAKIRQLEDSMRTLVPRLSQAEAQVAQERQKSAQREIDIANIRRDLAATAGSMVQMKSYFMSHTHRYLGPHPGGTMSFSNLNANLERTDLFIRYIRTDQLNQDSHSMTDPPNFK